MNNGEIMIKYKSNTFYLVDDLFYVIVCLGISSFLTYFFRDKIFLFLSGLVISILLLVILIIKLRRLARVEFYENEILLKFLFPWSIKCIEYSSIKEYQHIQRFKFVSLNVIKYLDSQSTDLKKIHITTVVPNNDYNEFVKWIKQKNNDIIFTFLPPDINLLDQYKMEFGDS